MPRFPKLISFACSLSLVAAAQSPATPPQPSPQDLANQAPTYKITTGTELVVVDVVVQDRDGHPIHGLKVSDFKLEEAKAPQAIKSFEEHTSATEAQHAKPVAIPKMPPGTFTDFEPLPPDTTLNVLLLDALNTPMTAQAYVRNQLQQFVKKASPGTRIAIFGLNSRLTLLQGFSADPEILKSAVDHKLTPRGSVVLDDPSGSNVDTASLSDTMSDAGASATAIASVQQFEAETAAFQAQLRTRYTIDAFNQLARYLAQFPGRKNLIWFSGSFPLTIFPDPSLDDPFAVQTDNSEELRETTSLLARARVAVYPIDARGLQAPPMFDASQSGRGYTRNPGKFGADLSKFNQQNTQEHFAMQQIADDSGGRAFYNTNGLAEAVKIAIDSGANFYTVAYTPSNRNWKGEYRKIRVQLAPEYASRGYKLTYRNGYYAEDPNKPRTAGTTSVLSAAAAAASTPTPGSFPFAHSAMQRGAPTPSEILFKARVLPHSTTTEDTLAPNNTPNPNGKLKPPYRRYDVDFAALSSDFLVKAAADGRRVGAIEFVTFVYDADGMLLNAVGATINLNMSPQTYKTMLSSGLGFHQEVSAPGKGESFLRIAVHDLPSGKFGVLEVPTSSVSRLPPPAAIAPPQSPAPATPAPTGATPPPK